jgi:uncharacterized YccA/Bax inhibitor family protein
MALMNGSPVLTDDRFGQAAQAAPYTPGAARSTMTIGGTITATGVLLVLLSVAGAFGWAQVPEYNQFDELTGRQINAPVGAIPGWVFLMAFVALGLGIATALRPRWARITAPLYSLAIGVWVGAISHVYNASYDGIVTQALFATVSIFAAMLLLYATRIIKVTNRFVMIVVGCTMGIALMYLVAFVVQLFGGQVGFLHEPSALGIGLSVFIIAIAALNLAIDFAFIERAAAHEMPKYLEWYGAYGITVTMVWIYLEVLRLLAMLNRR